MGLFDKKYCDFCGSKIGLLGNKKLEDGNMCKDCASKLSPWFSDRRHTTKAEIAEQLDYREKNKAAVREFTATRKIGNYMKLILDEDHQKLYWTIRRRQGVFLRSRRAGRSSGLRIRKESRSAIIRRAMSIPTISM